MEDVIEMNGSEATVNKAGIRMSKAELFDIATMLGLFIGVVGIISLLYGDFSLLP